MFVITILFIYYRTLEYLEEVAIDAAKKLVAGQKLTKRNKNKTLVDSAIDLALKQEWLREKFFDSAKGKVLKMSRGLYPAPLKVLILVFFIKSSIHFCYNNDIIIRVKTLFKLSSVCWCFQIIDVVKTGIAEGTTKGYAAESNGFAELSMTPQSKSLIGLFQAQTECKKNKFGEPKIALKLVY